MKKHLKSFITVLLASIPLSLGSAITHERPAYAQEMDPVQEIQQFIAEGQAKIKKAKGRSYKGRYKVKKRVAVYFEALKSFSSALRRLNEYQIEDDQFFEQLESSFNEIMSTKEVSKKVKQMNSTLMSAIKEGDVNKANNIAQKLIDLDERRESIKYLLSVLAESSSDQ